MSSCVARFVILALVTAMLAPGLVAADSAASDPNLTVLVTGANRGLGLEFAKQFKAAGASVIATARRPAAADALNALGVRVEQLDVTDQASVDALVDRLGDQAIDLLINNAGIGSRGAKLETAKLDDVRRVLEVNTLGPIRVTQALLPALRRGDGKRIVNISSRLGSIGLNTGGGFLGYRESKAALNTFTRSIAAEFGNEGFVCIAMSPGWVRTDMGGPDATLSPEESISGMIKVIEGLDAEDNGLFFDHAGASVVW